MPFGNTDFKVSQLIVLMEISPLCPISPISNPSPSKLNVTPQVVRTFNFNLLATNQSSGDGGALPLPVFAPTTAGAPGAAAGGSAEGALVGFFGLEALGLR